VLLVYEHIETKCERFSVQYRDSYLLPVRGVGEPSTQTAFPTSRHETQRTWPITVAFLLQASYSGHHVTETTEVYFFVLFYVLL